MIVSHIKVGDHTLRVEIYKSEPTYKIIEIHN